MTRAEVEELSPLLEENFEAIMTWLQETKRTKHKRRVDRRAVLRAFLDTKDVYRTAVQIGCSHPTVLDIVAPCLRQVRRIAGVPPITSAPKYPALAPFAWRLKLARLQKTWNQKRTAREAHVALNYYRRVERADLNPSLLGTMRMAEALGVTIGYLVAGEEGGPARPTEGETRTPDDTAPR